MNQLGDPRVRKQILERIATLKPQTPARWGRMNSHQMLCHLNDSFLASMGRKGVSPAGSLLHRTAMKWAALYLPAPWPKGVPTRPEVEQGAGGTPPGEFLTDRGRLIRLIEEFSDPNRRFRWAPHPMFGRMAERQWLRWGYLHTDHHLRQFGA